MAVAMTIGQKAVSRDMVACSFTDIHGSQDEAPPLRLLRKTEPGYVGHLVWSITEWTAVIEKVSFVSSQPMIMNDRSYKIY